MRYSSKAVEKLVGKYQEISILGKISALLGWDLNVNLPPLASDNRASQEAFVTKLISQRWKDEAFVDTLRAASKEKKLTDHEKAIVRNLNHAAKYYHKVPEELIVEFSKASSRAFVAWRAAREKADFSIFAPHLAKMVQINRLIAKHIGYKNNPYDALLDIYEPGLTASECKAVFAKLTAGTRQLLTEIKKTQTYKKSIILPEAEYALESQKKIADFVLNKIGYDFKAGRMDVSAHPFTTELGRGDIRITNRYDPHNFIESIMVAMHEGGHALYEQGVDEEYSDTPLEGGVSLGIHESQSRFWENQVGRSREFVNYITATLKAFYPEQLAEDDARTLYQKFNQVRPSLIRVEADEVTYNLHIALRFELEEALINGKLDVNDLPKEWNKKMKKYLGIVPQNDAEGVLQDVHWSNGAFGYFPTYTLGNLYAAQFCHAMRKEIDVDGAIKTGELGIILSWLRENIHRHGSVYLPSELVLRITKKGLDPSYFIKYLNQKYKSLYV